MKVTLSLLVLCVVLLGLCLAYPFPDAEAVAEADPHKKRYGGYGGYGSYGSRGRYSGGGYTGYAYGGRGPISNYRIGNGSGIPLGHVYMG
ncbi:neuropeptide-like protein 29 [Macrobrachium nipponense]|uniref:neuropeptide-like protein 29 n=1 Tax=Macrobrachium nipponense TaxID=159736 RepID=UPI0030C88441